MIVNRLRRSFEDRRQALQSVTWLRPALLAADLILLVAGLFIHPVLGFVFGLILIVINEWLTPVIVRRIFIKDLGGELNMTGTLTRKVIRGATPNRKGRKSKPIKTKQAE